MARDRPGTAEGGDSCGKSSLFIWENPLYMVMFNSYVELPEGIYIHIYIYIYINMCVCIDRII